MGSISHGQAGYGAFSVSASNRDAVTHYIEHQPEHHARRSFEDEFVSLFASDEQQIACAKSA